MDGKLVIHVDITGSEEVSCGGEKYAIVRFGGYADGGLFNGKILPGGADCQHFTAGEGTLSARYILEGTDFAGNSCRIFIENNADISGEYTRPMLFTDSPALKEFSRSELTGRIINDNGKLTIEISGIK